MFLVDKLDSVCYDVVVERTNMFLKRKERGMVLTKNEFNGLEKIAERTGMDCWFHIIQVDGNDVVRDFENGDIMLLSDALREWPEEEFTEDCMNMCGLNEEEQTEVINLVANKLKIIER